jgi:hypothetical protein
MIWTRQSWLPSPKPSAVASPPQQPDAISAPGRDPTGISPSWFNQRDATVSTVPQEGHDSDATSQSSSGDNLTTPATPVQTNAKLVVVAEAVEMDNETRTRRLLLYLLLCLVVLVPSIIVMVWVFGVKEGDDLDQEPTDPCPLPDQSVRTMWCECTNSFKPIMDTMQGDELQYYALGRTVLE